MMSVGEQLSIWDVEIEERPILYAASEEKITGNEELVAYIINEIQEKEIDNVIKPSGITEKQKEFLEKNNILENENLSRVILYAGGGLGIEISEDNILKTSYISREGQKEFVSEKKSIVTPMDKIIYCIGEFKANELQEKILAEISEESSKIIRRKGDENILIEMPGKVISIIPKGWILEYNGCSIRYDRDEIEDQAAPEADIKVIQQNVSIGDIVEARIKSGIINGEIVNVYGLNNMILSIIFDNGKKHTAISRNVVTKILKDI